MGWLGLEWGNVPSWVSTGGLIIAAAVYVRDRSHRLKFQAQSVGVWATVDIVLQTGGTYARIGIHAHNASDLPVSIRYVWCRVNYNITSINSSYRQSNEPASLLRYAPATIPPKSTVTLTSDLMCKLQLDDASDATFGIVDANALVKRFEVIDNTGIEWAIYPIAGRSSRRVRRFGKAEEES